MSRRLLRLALRDRENLANNSLVPKFLSYPSLQSERKPGNEVGPITGGSGPNTIPETILGLIPALLLFSFLN